MWKKCWKKPIIIEYREVKKGEIFDTDDGQVLVQDDDQILIKDQFGQRLVHKSVFFFNYDVLEDE